MVYKSEYTDFNGNLVIVKPLVEFNLWILFIYDILKCFKTKFIKTFFRNNQNIFRYFIRFIFNCLDCKSCKLSRISC